jgi:hypothetical protein
LLADDDDLPTLLERLLASGNRRVRGHLHDVVGTQGKQCGNIAGFNCRAPRLC